MRILNRVPDYLGSAFEELDQRAWSTLRISLGIALMLFAQWPDPRPLANLPNELLNPPPGLPQLVDGVFFRSTWFLETLHLAGVAFVLAFILGVRGSAWAVTGWAILAHAVLFSVGKIDHTYLPWLFPAALASSGWGRRPPQPLAFSSTLAPAALLMSVSWLTAALPKVKGGWLDPGTQYVAGFLANGPKLGPLGDWFLGLPNALLECVDWAVILLELALPVLFLGTRRLRVLAVLLAVAFHFSALAVFGIGGDGLAVGYAVLVAPSIVRLRPESFKLQIGALTCVAALWRGLTVDDRLQIWIFKANDRPEVGAAIIAYTLVILIVFALGRSRSSADYANVHAA